MSRRLRRSGLLGLVLLAVAAPEALAHPLGNFSVNHLATVRISDDRVDVRYVLDQAEVPTFQERDAPIRERLARVRGEVFRSLAVSIDGRRAALRAEGPGRIELRPGQAGLETLRVELDLRAPADGARRVELRDGTFDGRVGWKAIVAAPGDGTSVRADAPSGDPTNELRSYPEDVLESPADRRTATFSVEPGDGTLIAPAGEGGAARTTRSDSGDGFAAVFERAAAGEGVFVLFLLAAFGWGALHALSPGHGKAMVAAYLVGRRGTARHAVALGAIVTITHTIGVFALGVATLALSAYVLPEDLYPWLTIVSGLLVVGIGAGVLVRRARSARSHHHHHHGPERVSWKGLIGMGASAGLIPCPSALVVLLGAVAQHEVALGLLLVTAFSLGLAATLTVLGLAVVYAGRLGERIHVSARLTAALPVVSAAVIVALGCALTLQAVPEVM